MGPQESRTQKPESNSPGLSGRFKRRPYGVGALGPGARVAPVSCSAGTAGVAGVAGAVCLAAGGTVVPNWLVVGL